MTTQEEGQAQARFAMMRGALQIALHATGECFMCSYISIGWDHRQRGHHPRCALDKPFDIDVPFWEQP